MPLDLYINVTHSIFYFLAAVYSPHVRDQVKKFPSSQFPFHPTTSYNLNTQLNIAFNEIDSLLFLFVVSQILQFFKFSCFLGPLGPLVLALYVCMYVILIAHKLIYTVYPNTKSSTALQIHSTAAL